MPDANVSTTWTLLLLAGLAGSLHCIGMCGPILLAFSQSFAASRKSAAAGAQSDQEASTAAAGETHANAAAASKRDAWRGLGWDFVWYHGGRIWTYALLGLIVGYAGHLLRHGSALVGWQHTPNLVLGIMVVLAGVLMLGVVPGLRLDRWVSGCGFSRCHGRGWFATLTRTGGPAARLLLGVIMGFLPCGLVYAALVMAATLPTPWHSAAGMVVFGAGTIPSLSTVLIASRLLPANWRGKGMRLAAACVIVGGLWMVLRASLELCPGHAQSLANLTMLSQP